MLIQQYTNTYIEGRIMVNATTYIENNTWSCKQVFCLSHLIKCPKKKFDL